MLKKSIMVSNIETKLNRLVRLIGSDEGFYILALHSFVEYYLRLEKGYGQDLKFHQLTWKYREELLNKYGEETFIEELFRIRPVLGLVLILHKADKNNCWQFTILMG